MASRTRALTEVEGLAMGEDVLAGMSTDGFAWLHDGGGIVGSGVAARVAVTLDDAPAAAAELLGSIAVENPLGLAGTGPLAAAAFPFDRRCVGELVVPAWVVGRDRQGRAWVTETSAGDGATPGRGAPADDDPGGRQVEPTRFVVDGRGDRSRWTAAVAAALERIDKGTLAKVVLARAVTVEADSPFHIGTVVDRLRHAHPSCFTYAVGGFVGASPELLARRRDELVVSRPMAGTVERGDTVAEDTRLLAQMTSSAKETAEHRVVVDAVRAALAPVCEEVSASARPEVARLATVAHLATTVAGRLRSPALSALAVASLLHPTPAVAGSPLPDALDAIAELEDFDRGRYSGPVGWVDVRGDGDWAVAVRCATIEGARATLAAGAGIVAGSQPEDEWAETQSKLDPMLRALVRP
ncbi:MAG: isochorismate synthase [Acidimicrobiales bacterium]